MSSGSQLGRADIASNLKLSLRSVDRFIERHGLRGAPGRRVFVRRDSYAWCLVKLRHHSTRSKAPGVRSGMPAPMPLQPGEELILLTPSEGFNLLHEAIQRSARGCTIATPDGVCGLLSQPCISWSVSGLGAGVVC